MPFISKYLINMLSMEKKTEAARAYATANRS